MKKEFIKNFTLEQAQAYFESIGQKKYRGRQLLTWLFARNAASFEEMTDFSKQLRGNLAKKFIVTPLEFEERLISKIDGTEKFLFRTHDGHYIESVLIKREGHEDGRLTICISSQIGCPMGCTYCETAKMGFIRDLEVAEIVDQVNQVRRITGLDNQNIVFMGMGEPFMNYAAVIQAARNLNYSFGFHISARRITISTCGILPMLEKFIDDKEPFNLALSLNDTDPAVRLKNMPVERKYPIKKIADLFNHKFPASRNRLTLEYVMRTDNIGRDNARAMKKLFRFTKIKLNIITLNKGAHNIEIPTRKQVDEFVQELQIMNVPITLRKSYGEDINGACGQLAGKKYSLSR